MEDFHSIGLQSTTLVPTIQPATVIADLLPLNLCLPQLRPHLLNQTPPKLRRLPSKMRLIHLPPASSKNMYRFPNVVMIMDVLPETNASSCGDFEFANAWS
jgi:hypothetical protein